MHDLTTLIRINNDASKRAKERREVHEDEDEAFQEWLDHEYGPLPTDPDGRPIKHPAWRDE